MKQGVLLFCFDTEHTQYHKILERCVPLVKKNLKLEIDRDGKNTTLLIKAKRFKNKPGYEVPS